MANSWTSKDKRMYEHIRVSAKERGKTPERARALAARSVNKRRRLEGRTPNVSTRGTGNPFKPLHERTVTELRNRAATLNIRGRSSMNKMQLVRAIRDRN